MRTHVHVVDDDPSFLVSIGRLLRGSGYDVSMYESATQLLDNMPDVTRPGCLLLDIQLPGLSGPELQSRLVAMDYGLPIVFLSGHGDIPTTVRAMKAGAEDVLTKPVAVEQLTAAIERAVRRYRDMRERVDRLGALRRSTDTLTPRERQVFERVVQGRTNKEIARELGTSPRTIKAHRQKVMQKVGAQSLAELVLVAERLGVLAAPEERPPATPTPKEQRGG